MSEKIKEMALEISYEKPFLKELDTSSVVFGDAYSTLTLSPDEAFAVIGDEPSDEGDEGIGVE